MIEKLRNKLLPSVATFLRAFMPETKAFNDSTRSLGDFIAEHNKSKYLFYIQNNLSARTVDSIKFRQSLAYCGKHNIKFVIIAKTWDETLESFLKSAENHDFKIISYDKLENIGKRYIKMKHFTDLDDKDLFIA